MKENRLSDDLGHIRIIHGYFDTNLDVVWETVQTALPELLKQLAALRRN